MELHKNYAKRVSVVVVPSGHTREMREIATTYENGFYITFYGIRLRDRFGSLGSTIAFGGYIDDALGCGVFIGEDTEYVTAREMLVREAKALGAPNANHGLDLDRLRREADARDRGDRNGAPV